MAAVIPENEYIYGQILSQLKHRLTQKEGLQGIKAQMKQNNIKSSYKLIEFFYKQIKDPFDYNPRDTAAFMNWLTGIGKQSEKYREIIDFINNNGLLNYEGGRRRMHRKRSHTRRHKKARKHTRRQPQRT
jgi:hypothetical protein